MITEIVDNGFRIKIESEYHLNVDVQKKVIDQIRIAMWESDVKRINITATYESSTHKKRDHED